MSCGRLPAYNIGMPVPPDLSPSAQVAVTFAKYLVCGDFVAAAEFLAPNLRDEYPPIVLADRLLGMFRGYSRALPTEVHFDPESGEMFSWPDKQPDDLGWAYVSISGEDFNEAVTCVVAAIDGRNFIRQLEWGRP